MPVVLSGNASCASLTATSVMASTGTVSLDISGMTPEVVYSGCTLFVKDHGNNLSNALSLSTFVAGDSMDDFCLHPDLTIPETECRGLYTLYDATDGTNRTSAENRFENLDVDTWYGITTTGTNTQNITQISLNTNNLAGTVPDGFAVDTA